MAANKIYSECPVELTTQYGNYIGEYDSIELAIKHLREHYPAISKYGLKNVADGTLQKSGGLVARWITKTSK